MDGPPPEGFSRSPQNVPQAQKMNRPFLRAFCLVVAILIAACASHKGPATNNSERD